MSVVQPLVLCYIYNLMTHLFLLSDCPISQNRKKTWRNFIFTANCCLLDGRQYGHTELHIDLCGLTWLLIAPKDIRNFYTNNYIFAVQCTYMMQSDNC